MDIKDREFEASASGTDAVRQLGELAIERERTKRLLIGAACLFLLVAAAVMLFAPDGGETLAYVLGAALLVVALGAIGVAQFKFKLPGVNVETGTPPPTSPERTRPERSTGAKA